MSTTDYTAQALTAFRTSEAERRLENRRRATERRAAIAPAARPVAPSRGGFAALLFHVLHGTDTAASH